MLFHATVRFDKTERELIELGFYLSNLYVEGAGLSDVARARHVGVVRSFLPHAAYKGQFTAEDVNTGIFILATIKAYTFKEAEDLEIFKGAPKHAGIGQGVPLIPDPAHAVAIIAEAREKQRKDIDAAVALLKASRRRLASLEEIAKIYSVAQVTEDLDDCEGD